MKKKFARILGVGLTLALISGLMVMATPASALTLLWYQETAIPKTPDGTLAPAVGFNIVDLAVNGDTMYVAPNDTVPADNATYKSTNGGQTWTSLVNTTYYPNKEVKLIAVAPDDPGIVAMVTSDNKVYYSTSGGASWSSLGKPADAATGKTSSIDCIDVSPGLGDYRYIAVAGDNGTVGTVATVDTFFLGVGGAWYVVSDDSVIPTVAGFASSQTTVKAVKFSPNYWTDKIITCISGNATGAYFQAFWDESNKWNGFISAYGSNYPVSIPDTASTATYLGEIPVAASIALPSTYLGGDETERIAFVGVATASKGGVWRLSDYSIGASGTFATWSAGDEGKIKSIAYNDSGKLLAGAKDESKVYHCLSPMASYPRFDRVNSLKQPGGTGETIVAWSGDTAVAGTSGDESALAVSTDDGYSFNDISLIDTELSIVSDIAVSADGSKLYMASYNGTDASIWVRESSWARTLSLSGKEAILRLAPEDDSVVYAAFPGSTSVYVSKDSGKGLWKDVSCYQLTAAVGVQDMVVESADVVYAIDTAGCSKTTNAGASWGTKKPLEITGHMVTLAPNGNVLVGGSDGYVSVSSDGGATFVKTALVGSGPVQVIADKDYADNGIMYAAVGTGTSAYVSRSYTATPIGWVNYGPTLPDSSWSYKGLAENEGTVYALSSNGTESRLYRSFYMKTAASSTVAYWSHRATGYKFEATPQALKLSAGPTLWAVGTPNLMCSIGDPISTVGPTLKAPADGAVIQVNPATGRAYNVAFNWERYSSKYINACDLIIATDPAFKGVVYYNTFTGITSDSIAKVVGPTGSEVTIDNVVYSNRCDFMPGATYYWMARVSKDGPMYSPWSASRSFTVESATAFTTISPEQGATNVGLQPAFVWSAVAGATTYELVVSEDSTFAIIDWSHSTSNTFYQAEEVLRYDTTYYWRARPAGGDWTTGVFTTMAEAVEPVPTVVTVTEPAPPAAPPEIVTVEIPAAPAAPAAIPDSLLWAIIGIGAVLVIALIVLIVRTRRVA